MSAEHIRFFFDPICPWCYQTSRWIRQLEALGEVTASWGLFSLELANDGQSDRLPRSAASLRTALLVDERHGAAATGRFYATLGEAVHERGARVHRPDVITSALAEADLDPGLLDEAVADPDTWDRVVAQHKALVEGTGSFGVPTIVLDGGQGPAIFGPVISELPSDADAVELLRHVVWLTRYENFSELKRDRADPDLESIRRFRAHEARTQADDDG
ncbi:MAG: DsbA family protein [Egibacteraceae bacterium]